MRREIVLYAQVPSQASAQQKGQLPPRQLENLIAPIALYPDSLLAQVLAASTYPLQIVTAERWVKQNSYLQRKQLVEAAGRQNWNPCVQDRSLFIAELAFVAPPGEHFERDSWPSLM